MYPSLVYQLVILSLLLFLSAFFSASETSFTSCSSSKFYRLRKTKKVKRLLYLFDNKQSVISFILFGNTAVNIFSSSIATFVAIQYSLTHPIFGEHVVEVTAIFMTFVILIFTEITPKTFAIRNPERLILVISDLYFVLLKMFKPLIAFVNLVTQLILKMFGVHESKQYEVMTAIDSIRSEIEFHHSKGSVIQRDKDMLGGVLDLSEVKLHSVMTHRTDVDMINFNDITFEEIETKCVEFNHTRIPVYDGDPDRILGILHFRDLFTLKSFNNNPTLDDIRSILIKPQYASSETTLLAQLTEFKKTKNHIAIVVDEYGATIGIVTLEDIVEEIVGDIEDEHDDEKHDEDTIQIKDDEFIIDGAILIRDFIKKSGIELQMITGVSTMAGLVIKSIHKIPKTGAVYNIQDIEFKILDADAHKIQKMSIKKLHTLHDDE